MRQPIIVLTGPTAVGKTDISIRLAKETGGEIISADSMQVYRHMDIGTAKVRPYEMQGIPHYMIDEWEPDEEFNVFIFQKKVKEYIRDIHARGKIPILAGGTGFYIQAVLYDIAFTENQKDSLYRQKLQEEAQEKGAHALHDKLRRVDPESAEVIHENNIKRVIRALEYYQFTGEKFSEHNARERKRISPYNFLYVVLTMNREKLYQRIDQRVDRMMEQGLADEVGRLLDKGYKRDLVSMQGLGYKEIAAALEHECTMEEAVYRLKRDTRHFAKRQMTWFRREREVVMLDRGNDTGADELVQRIVQLAKERGVL